jgi:hypothetical protein
MQMHGGSVSIKSQPDFGTCAILHILPYKEIGGENAE